MVIYAIALHAKNLQTVWVYAHISIHISVRPKQHTMHVFYMVCVFRIYGYPNVRTSDSHNSSCIHTIAVGTSTRRHLTRHVTLMKVLGCSSNDIRQLRVEFSVSHNFWFLSLSNPLNCFIALALHCAIRNQQIAFTIL